MLGPRSSLTATDLRVCEFYQMLLRHQAPKWGPKNSAQIKLNTLAVTSRGPMLREHQLTDGLQWEQARV